jgi:cytoskeletal protein CcmA (bactofilin family)
VVLNGTVSGDVYARERVVIGPQARITGNVHYGSIEMALGAEVAGKLIPLNANANASANAAGRPGERVSDERNKVVSLPTNNFDASKAAN